MKISFVFSAGLAMASFQTGLLADSTLASRAASIGDFLASIEGELATNDRQRVSAELTRIESILDFYGYQQSSPRLFKLRQIGDRLEVYSSKSDTLLLNWHKHDRVEMRGPVIALLDTEKEFAAYRLESEKLVPIVAAWQKTVQYKLEREYVGLLDSDRIAEAYSIETKKKIITNWKNTVTAIFEPKYIVLLDDEADRNLEVYDTLGAKVIHFTGVTEVQKSGSFEISFVQNGEEKVLDLHNYLGFSSRAKHSFENDKQL